MEIRVVGAGVGRTGTHSLKLALEQLLGVPCHHMMEVFVDPAQIAGWMRAVNGEAVDWPALLERFGAIVDWPGASFWPELTAAFPDAVVLLSMRDRPEDWYRSASKTIFEELDQVDGVPPEFAPWMKTIRTLLRERFCDQFEDSTAMMDAYVRHNEAVRNSVPSSRLLEWRPSDGWEPICERLELAVPETPFPLTNTTDEFRAIFGLAPVEQ